MKIKYEGKEPTYVADTVKFVESAARYFRKEYDEISQETTDAVLAFFVNKLAATFGFYLDLDAEEMQNPDLLKDCEWHLETRHVKEKLKDYANSLKREDESYLKIMCKVKELNDIYKVIDDFLAYIISELENAENI